MNLVPSPRYRLILLTYGEPRVNRFSDQFWYSLSILNRLTRRVAPIPKIALPAIALRRARRRVREWNAGGNFTSPLEPVTERQAEALVKALSQSSEGAHWEVDVIYEFRRPMLVPHLRRLRDRPPDAVFILPLYLADSAFTDEISRSDVEKLEAKEGKLPFPVTYVSNFAGDRRMADLMADYIDRRLGDEGIGAEERASWGLILGSHGTLVNPPIVIETGLKATLATYEGIVEGIGGGFASTSIGWLNHVLGGKWTEPSLAEAAEAMIAAGVKKLVYYPFGFLADNAETILEGRMILAPFDFERVVHLPCMNDDPSLIEFLAGKAMEAAPAEPAEDAGSERSEAAVARSAAG